MKVISNWDGTEFLSIERIGRIRLEESTNETGSIGCDIIVYSDNNWISYLGRCDSKAEAQEIVRKLGCEIIEVFPKKKEGK